MAVVSRSTSPMLAPVVVVAEVEDIVEEGVAIAVEVEAIAAEVDTVEGVDMVAIKVAMGDTVIASKRLLREQKLTTLQAVVTQVVMVREIS
jgi:copper chaperone CopZ